MRRFGLAFNRKFDQYLFLVTPGSLILGFLFSDGLGRFVSLVPYLFGFVSFTMGLGCGLNQLRLVFVKPLPIVWTLAIAHLLLPLVSYGAGSLLFGASSPFTVGLTLFALIPLGVSSVIWVGMSGGSIALMLAMVVIDSMLSPLVVPAGIRLIFGAAVEVDTVTIMRDLLLIVVLPTLAGVLLHGLSRGRIQPAVLPYAGPVSKLSFAGVIVLNAAAIAPHAAAFAPQMARLVPVVVLLVGACYAAGYYGAAPFRSRETAVTVSFATGMRNISLGVVLALGYFSPMAAVPVVLSILIQQPAATLHHYVLHKLHKRGAGEMTATPLR